MSECARARPGVGGVARGGGGGGESEAQREMLVGTEAKFVAPGNP